MPEFFIRSYSTPFAQKASYLALHSSHFGPDGAVNYDYIVSNSGNSVLIGSRCIPNGAHTNHYWANLAHASKHIINSGTCILCMMYTVEPLYCRQHWDKCKCPNYRGVLISGLNLYYKAQFGTFLSVLNTGVSSFQGVLNRGFHCIYVSMYEHMYACKACM